MRLHDRDSIRRPGCTRTRRQLRWTIRGRTLALALMLLLAAIFTTPASGSASDNSEVETHLKAAFIYNFARFVEWPPRSAPGPLRIAILGRGDLASPLEEIIRGKSAAGRPIELAHLAAAAEMDCCEILLIERSESKRAREIVQTLAGKPVLTVCDSGNGLRDGVMIVFRIVEESVRFQINQEAAEHAGLKISSQLLKVAVSTGGKHL
jgi:hypothetical protein